MKRKLIARLRSRRGFTLAELLITILILSMATGIVAAGIPSATRAYTNAVDSANAQMLLSTTMTLLRDELSTASAVTVSEGNGFSISYTDAYGNRAKLYSDDGTGASEEGGVPGIYISISGAAAETGGTRLLVSREAGGKDSVYSRFTVSGYSKGLLSFSNLEVLSGAGDSAKVLAETGDFQIRVISFSGE